jgi:CHAT domain-containing protein
MNDAEVDEALSRTNRVALRVVRDPGYQGTNVEVSLLAGLQDALLARRRQDHALTIAWLRSVLLERRGALPEALAIVETIRADRAVTRKGTYDLGLKASVTGAFAKLAPRLTALRYACGATPAELFDAIEWGKGRALADSDEVELPRLAELSAAIAGSGLHYVTLMVDRTMVFGILVPSRGAPVVAEPVPLGSERALETAVNMLRGHPVERRRWARGLEQVLAWVPAPCKDGLIRPGEVVLIAPAGSLHLLPLHALHCHDRVPLAPRVAVVRTHGAAEVMSEFARPSKRPHRRLAVRVPCANDVLAVHADQVAPVHASLGARADEVLEEGAADAEAVWRKIKPSTIVHFSTHGGFRGPLHDGNPYEDAGIALAYDSRLPTIATIRGANHLFTPSKLQRLLAAEASPSSALVETHITLQACVSGHARANPQGDAVGLEWAFLLAGAASVLSTHWDVQLGAASRFCATFYHAWVSEKTTRAEAWRRAVEGGLRDAKGDDHWQAFTLSGAWA